MSVLIGTIVPVGYNADGSITDGYLSCNGEAVEREKYANLFASISTFWGAGDGKSTFNVPDLRGLLLRGVSDGTGKDPDAGQRTSINNGGSNGDAVGSLQSTATALPSSVKCITSIPQQAPGSLQTIDVNGNHTHNVPGLPVDSSWYKIAGSHYAQWNSGGGNTSLDGAHVHSVSSGGDSESRPVNVYVGYMIYYGTL
ncbi:phage tail protein [Flavobacterium artemisiae]|uniref:Phage tail protein n=1 Tax=Flavobacterium artemisiae TaxID=2126556 RepID=A0ABW4H7W7_9FLAO